MERRLRISLFAALSLLASPAIRAAETPEGEPPMALEQCVRTALEKHGSVLSANEDVAAARAGLRSAGSSLWYPTVSARTGRNEGERESHPSGGLPSRISSMAGEDHRLTLGVQLYDGGQQRQAVRRARADETSAEAALRRTQLALALNVTAAYVQLLKARHTLEVADKRVELAQAQKAMVQGRIKAGAAADVDIYPIEVQIASARVEQIKAANDVRVTGSALRNAMGLDAGKTPDIVELPEDLQEPPALDACIQEALTARPETAQSVAGMDRSRASLALTKLRTKPLIISSAQFDRGFGATSIATEWLVSAALSWSLFNRGDRADVDSATAGLRALEEDYRQLRKDIISEVEQAHLAVGSARERVEASRASVTAARKNLEVAEAKYKLDLGILIEIVDAQVAYSNAELQAIQARYDYFLARAQLDRAMGRGPLEAESRQ